MQEHELGELRAAFKSDIAQSRTGDRGKLVALVSLSDSILSYAEGMLCTPPLGLVNFSGLNDPALLQTLSHWRRAALRRQGRNYLTL